MRIITILACFTLPLFFAACAMTGKQSQSTAKLYWFIPDGMRTDPDIFDIYKWADEGKLPNIKKMMERGSYGYSIPVFPSHTPTNFATLLTGVTPDKHGVADGPMRTEGVPLDRVAVAGFSSVAKRREPIWVTMEKAGKNVALLSVPGSTPPEIDRGLTFRGRWGGWGADVHALNFQSADSKEMRRKTGRANRLFFFGPQLTNYVEPQNAKGWSSVPKGFSPAKEIKATGWGATVYFYIFDSTDDKEVNYDKVAISIDRKEIINILEQGDWADWHPVKLKWKNFEFASHVKAHVIKLGADGFFRFRILYDNMNEFLAEPSQSAAPLVADAGPMVDFVDNFPPQLIHFPEDKKTFLDEANESLKWHKKAAAHILDKHRPDVYIQDIYTPNQMLTSRWWMGSIDPQSARYRRTSSSERDKLWEEVKDMYLRLDEILGEMLSRADKNTYVVLSSDHGAVPLDRWVRLNNLFAKKGWLKFRIDSKTGEPRIDWKSSKVIYLKMAHIYINPKGLDGSYTRASGAEYEKLRSEVMKSLKSLTDANGLKPVEQVYPWEKVGEFLDLPADRVGDLVVVNRAGYGWNEEMTADGKIFGEPLKSGYKQAIMPKPTKGMWTPFMILGPGIKSGYRLKEPIAHVDQYTTLLDLMDVEAPHKPDGRVLGEIRK